MKIVYVSSSAVPSRAANSVQVMRMCDAFARAGHEVKLYCRPAPNQPHPADVETIRRHYGVSAGFAIELVAQPAIRFLGRALYARRVARLLAREAQSADLIYGRDLYSLLALRALGVTMVYEAHMPPANAGKRAMCARLFAQPNFRRLVVVSERLGEYYREQFVRLGEKEVVVAPNGADNPGDVAPGEPTRSVGYVGQLHAHKGPALVVELARALPEVDFHIVGGSQVDIARFSADAPHNLTFHGHVGQGELGAYYRSFKVVLAPYRRAAQQHQMHDDTEWGSPLKIFEYMAHGCAMVASDLPVIRELVGDNEAALLCGSDDLAAWKSAVTTLLQNEPRRATLSSAARERFLAHYTREARVAQVL